VIKTQAVLLGLSFEEVLQVNLEKIGDYTVDVPARDRSDCQSNEDGD
jgi:hypothetical protein